jgi:glycosyltransferase involved in cell wall biosynthesis
MEHPLAWKTFLAAIESDRLYREMTLREALTAFQMIQRNMQILSIDPPQTDVVHCSLAWFPALLAICAKMEHGSPVLITEHGVAFRELLLYYNAYLTDEPANIFWKQLSKNLVSTIYWAADVIGPVCYANAKWELELGADPSKVHVIYNGVDINKFKPMKVPKNDKPIVACIGRVDIFKDIINLIQAINLVKAEIPEIECRIYGSSTDLEYSIRCIDAVRDLGLEDTVKFIGRIKDPETAYNAADVVVISSITEGFPFAIIEAMACGRGIVATDVGGIREALQGCGIMVRSNHPRELASAIISLLRNPQLREQLGAAAVSKVRDGFTLEQSINQYRKQYERLIALRAGSRISAIGVEAS